MVSEYIRRSHYNESVSVLSNNYQPGIKEKFVCWLNEGHSWFALIWFDILSFIVKNTKWMKFALFLFLGKSIFYHLYLVLYLIIKLIWVCMFVGGRLQHLRDLGEWFSMYVLICWLCSNISLKYPVLPWLCLTDREKRNKEPSSRFHFLSSKGY